MTRLFELVSLKVGAGEKRCQTINDIVQCKVHIAALVGGGVCESVVNLNLNGKLFDLIFSKLLFF